MPLLPKVFHGKADEDVRSWFANLEVVFFTKGISSFEDKLRWTRAFVNDAAERYFDIFPLVNSWEDFKSAWIQKFTLGATDLKYRRHFRAVKQQQEDIEIYIDEFQKRLERISDLGEREVFTIFID